jgi:hypothetical protein
MWRLKKTAFLFACGKRCVGTKAPIRTFLLVSLFLWLKRFPWLVLKWLTL